MIDITHARLKAALADRYAFDGELGHGGMGTVYLARDVKHGRSVAIKALSAEVGSQIGARQFLREIRNTAQLQHPHILALLDSGETADCPYYVMPYLKGGSLRELLNRRKRLSLNETLAMVRDIGDALHYAHENGLVHCDIKPENILMSAGHAVLADFGIARAQHREWWMSRAQVDSSAGTPAYMSPEQASGERDLDARSDLYSFACVVFEMLAGQAPFTGETDQAVIARRFLQAPPDLNLVAHVPSTVAAVVRKAMAVNPDRRHGSLLRFVAAFEAAVAAIVPVSARPRWGVMRRFSDVIATLGYRLVARLRARAARARDTLDSFDPSAAVRLPQDTLA